MRPAASGSSPYLAICINDIAPDLALDLPLIRRCSCRAARRSPRAICWSSSDYAETLRLIAKDGPEPSMAGRSAARITDYLQSCRILRSPRGSRRLPTIEREPVRGIYRGVEIVGPPPPCSGGVHTVQILNMLEALRYRALGFGTRRDAASRSRGLKIAAADRRRGDGRPGLRRRARWRGSSPRTTRPAPAGDRLHPCRTFAPRILANDSVNTTHVTIADGHGNIVTSTQTINSLFGARIMIPGTGIISQQLHVPVRSASRFRAVAAAGQTDHQRHHLSGRQARRRRSSRSACPARTASSLRACKPS